ncbi:MAG TPA: S49 family peptidase, partial [Candidatus Krumholzibacterium sp.]|nr:S49 family peptidase [Candidatus Krumholzibacterium sp.]
GMTTSYVLGTLEKLGINQQMHRIKDYKSAAEMVMRKDMSPTVRENRNWMLDGYWELYCEALEEDRGITEEKIVALMEKALIPIEVAVEEGFIDGVKYWDEVETVLLGEGKEKLQTVGQARYAEEKPGDLGLKGKKKIAVIHAQGTIGGRKNRVDPLLGIMMGHETIVAELKKAEKDDDIAAIVFRVDSPGGEGLASDLIGHQVEVTAKVKPVVVSMVDVAGSGGYHISYRATRIVADEHTVTGSIGSISGKMNIAGLHDKIGMSHDFVTRGPHALFYSEYRDFTEDEWKIFTEDHWRGFNDWLRDVQEHRGIETFEEAEKLAHGRIFTGRQGAENGLVDETGDLVRAVEVAKELAEIDADEKVTVEHYPKQRGFFEELVGGNLTAVARYTIFRFRRGDLQETWESLSGPGVMMMEDIEID